MTNSFFQLPRMAPLKLFWSWSWREVMIVVPTFLFAGLINYACEGLVTIILVIILVSTPFIACYLAFKWLDGIEYEEFTLRLPSPNTFKSRFKLFIVACIPMIISFTFKLFLLGVIATPGSIMDNFLRWPVYIILSYYFNLKLLTTGLFGQKFVVIPVQKNSKDGGSEASLST